MHLGLIFSVLEQDGKIVGFALKTQTISEDNNVGMAFLNMMSYQLQETGNKLADCVSVNNRQISFTTRYRDDNIAGVSGCKFDLSSDDSQMLSELVALDGQDPYALVLEYLPVMNQKGIR